MSSNNSDPLKETVTTSKKRRRKPLSKAFTEVKSDYSPEEILSKCPEVINPSKISLKGSSYNNRRQLLAKYKAKGKKYKWWNENDRIQAATVYAMVGNAQRVEEITGIPCGTIRAWKTTEWWPQIIDRIRAEADDELDVKITHLIDKSVKEINERLDKGDYIYDTKTGELKRKPLNGKDMAVMTSIFVDKRELLRKQKDIKTQETTVNDRLKKLFDEFTKFTKARTIEGDKVNVEQGNTEEVSHSPVQGEVA